MIGFILLFGLTFFKPSATILSSNDKPLKISKLPRYLFPVLTSVFIALLFYTFETLLVFSLLYLISLPISILIYKKQEKTDWSVYFFSNNNFLIYLQKKGEQPVGGSNPCCMDENHES